MKRLITRFFILASPVLILGSLTFITVSSKTKTTLQNLTAKIVPAFDISSLDLNFKPTDDFDSYANGNWKKNNPIPATEGNWGAFGILNKENNEVNLKGIIDRAINNKTAKPGSDEQKIADMYRSYMDTASIEKLGLTPLKKYIAKIDAIKSLKDWTAVSGELQMIGVSSVVGIYVDADDRNSKMNAVKWSQSGLSLGEKSYYSGKDERMTMIRAEFVKYIDKMMGLCNRKVINPGQTILDFETELAAIQLSNVEMRDPIKTYNKIPTSELSKLSPKVDWVMFAA